MASAYTSEQIRNIALVGASAGKTTLADLLLFKTGAVTRRGRPSDGTSALDHTDEEKSVRHTTSSKFVHFAHDGKQIHLLDTPGYPDYVGEAMAALAAVDAAVRGDRRQRDDQLQRAAPLQGGARPEARHVHPDQPDGRRPGRLREGGRARHRDCSAATATRSTCRAATGPPSSRSSSLLAAGADAKQRTGLIDCLVETDEKAMEKYLESGSVDAAEVDRLYFRAVKQGLFVPILCASGDKDVGVAEFLDHVTHFAPSPVEATGRRVKTKEGEAGAVHEGGRRRVRAGLQDARRSARRQAVVGARLVGDGEARGAARCSSGPASPRSSPT